MGTGDLVLDGKGYEVLKLVVVGYRYTDIMKREIHLSDQDFYDTINSLEKKGFIRKKRGNERLEYFASALGIAMYSAWKIREEINPD